MANRKNNLCLKAACLVMCVVYVSILYTITIEACLVCIPYPLTTLADNLIGSDTVIMARERSDKPYSFFAVDVLKGSRNKKDFEAFINSTARRMLKQNPEDVVVFRREDAKSDWQYIAYADFEYQQFIRSILWQSSRWQEFKGNRHRIDFFAELLNHRDQQIREQAYLEVGRAPYASIKRIAGIVSRQQIREFLDKWRFTEWHSLYILMLGQSRDPDDLAYIRKQLESTAAHGLKTNLSAWVVAFVETNPKTGVEEIENLYFSNKNRTAEELQEVCKGLSVLGSEGSFRFATELVDRRHRIVNSYGTLLENHPLMAGPVAKDLTNWQIFAFVDRLTQIKENDFALNPDTEMAITYYLSISINFQHIKTNQ